MFLSQPILWYRFQTKSFKWDFFPHTFAAFCGPYPSYMAHNWGVETPYFLYRKGNEPWKRCIGHITMLSWICRYLPYLFSAIKLTFDHVVNEIVSKFLFSLHVVNVSIIWLTSPLDFISAINLSFDHVVKVTILMRDINSYAEVNRAYEKFFPNKRYPARACYAVKDLPLTAKLEIEAIAASGNNIIYDWRNVLIPLIVGTALMKSSE